MVWIRPADNRCEKCLARLRRDDQSDAYYCPMCVEWKSSLCVMPNCHYCLNRPAQPGGVR